MIFWNRWKRNETTRPDQTWIEAWNDVAFTGQRIRWTQDPQTGPYIEVSQEKTIEELEEIPVERNTKEDLQRTPAMQTMYTSLLGQINWLQRKDTVPMLLQVLQVCFNGNHANNWRCWVSQQIGETDQDTASEASILATNWPLRTLGFLDACYRNNDDGSSQRGMTVFLALSRERSWRDGMTYGSLIDNESQIFFFEVLSTAVAELYSFMKCFGSCQFLHGLWMDVSSEVANIHMRTDSKNLITTARNGSFTWADHFRVIIGYAWSYGSGCYDNNVCLRRFMHPNSLVSDGVSDDNTWMFREIPKRNTIEGFTEEIDGAGFVGQYNFFYLPMRLLCLCLALRNLLLRVTLPSSSFWDHDGINTTLCGEVGHIVTGRWLAPWRLLLWSPRIVSTQHQPGARWRDHEARDGCQGAKTLRNRSKYHENEAMVPGTRSLER